MDDRCELLCLNLEVAEEIRSRRMEPARAFAAAERAHAVADPTRLMLAGALAEIDELCVCDLSWIAERSQNLVSHHLKVLRANGLVCSRRNGKMVMYALTEEGRAILQSVLLDEVALRA